MFEAVDEINFTGLLVFFLEFFDRRLSLHFNLLVAFELHTLGCQLGGVLLAE